jgi:MoxR-like ATPase
MTIYPAGSGLGSRSVAPENDAPTSGTISCSVMPSAPELSIPTPASLATERVVAMLPVALAWLRGRVLAEFDWQSVSGPEERTTVSVTAVEGSTLELAWVHSNQQQTVTAKVEAYCHGQQKVYLRLRIGKRFRDWCLAESTDVESWLDGKAVASLLPNPRVASGVEYLGLVWFSESTDHDSGVTRKGQSPAWRLPAVGRFWPQFRLKKAKRIWEIAALPSITDHDASEEWAGTVAAFAIWSLMTLLFQEVQEEDEPGSEAFGLPAQKEYFPQRAVSLNGSEVLAKLKQDAYRLRIPWHVIEAACASLNSGKHVLFTGPPGCGKSKLAIALAQIATSQRPLLVTASPAWTSGDLIGRYLPNRNGQGLSFVPGAFLRAAEEERWLIIDEFNRANVDECFGELFSVLANDTVELPFEGLLPEEGDGSVEQYATVRIVPAIRAAEQASDIEARYCDYQVSPSFRLIGTMNDADRTALHQLSFALQRRFDLIRVEAPPWDIVREIIDQKMSRLQKSLRHSYKFFQRKTLRTVEKKLDLDKLKEKFFFGLFARDPNGLKSGEVLDLVSERVIGLATVKDVMSFVAEGLRGPVSKGGEARVLLAEDMTTHGVAASYVAMGLVLGVFPQLEAVEHTRLVQIVRFIVNSFRDDDGNSLPMLRLTTLEQGEEHFAVERVRASDGMVIDQDGDTWISIPEYMISELTRQFKDTGVEKDLLALIRGEPQATD